MGRKKKEEKKSAFIIQWSSVSGDGWRVKHRLLRDEEQPDCYWHIEIRLTDNPALLYGVYEVYERKFFNKVWIAQRIEFKRRNTWIAIGEAIKQLERKEQLWTWKQSKKSAKRLSGE